MKTKTKTRSLRIAWKKLFKVNDEKYHKKTYGIEFADEDVEISVNIPLSLLTDEENGFAVKSPLVQDEIRKVIESKFGKSIESWWAIDD